MQSCKSFLLGTALSTLLASSASTAGPGTPEQATIRLEPLGSYREAVTVGGQRVCRKNIAQDAAYDPGTRRLFVSNPVDAAVDILDAADPRNLTLVRRVALAALGQPTSIAAGVGLIAVSVSPTGAAATERGTVVLLGTNGRILRRLRVGAGPDMVTFTPDGNTLLVANEGEPSGDYTRDPEGSISVVDLSAEPRRATVRTAGFRAFDAATLRRQGVRIFGPNATAAQDLEPEDIAVGPDGGRAWIVLQENNALAVLDIAAARITAIVGLGTKDHGRQGFGLDAGDEDGRINIRSWPVRGLYQPNGITPYRANGATYLLLANHGDPRQTDAFDETALVGDLRLDPVKFPNAATLQQDDRLGRLQVSTVEADTDGDGDVDRLQSFGGRSFSIRRADGTLVHDSGDQFERLTADDAIYRPAANLFNTPEDENNFDERSDRRGPQPDALAVASIGRRVYAFIGLESVGGIVATDVTDPMAPVFQHYANTRDFTQDPRATGGADTERYVNCAAGDLAPEEALVIPAGQSPTGDPLLIASYTTSGSTRVFRIMRPRRAG
jgi:DNA-binding beta-propeller fold protein YncE